MILLSGHSLTPVRRIPLESMSLKLKERESTADIVPADMTGIGMQSWVKDDTEPGAGIVWRVMKIQQAYADRTPTVTLEHAIGTLRDRILFGEITPATIKGVVGATTCTAREAVTYILNQQSDWTLGTFSYGSVENAYKFDGDTLLDALDKVSETLDECWWSYDFSTYPFTLNITAKPSGVACELRPGRNLVSITKSIDRTGMFTRHYPIGKNDLHITGNYVSKNENLYGISSKVEVDQSLETEAELRAWSNQRLNKHAEPVVNITADGLELAEATGENLDKLKLGRICRIPLQEFETVIEERIVELNYRDKVGEPENVRVTMANNHDDVIKILAEEIKTGGGRGGGGARGSARKDKQDLAWFEDTNSHVAMVAEGIVGVDAQGNPNWFRLSQIIVNDNGIDSSVQSIQGDMSDVNTWKVTAESRITQTETSISQVVTAVGENGQVTAASIIAAVNNGSSSIVLSADHIDIDGIVDELTAMTVEVDTLLATGVDVSGTIAADEVDATSSLTVNGYDVLVSNITKNQAGDTITVSFVDGTSWTFSKPASQQVTLSGAWSGRTFSVTASPSSGASPSIVNGVVYDGIVPVSGTTVYDSTNKNVKQDFIVYTDDNGDADQQIMRKTLTISATSAWNAGHTTGGSDAGVQIDTSDGKPYSIERAVSTNKKSFVVSADASISYNSTTHKYTATAKAKADSTEMDSDTDVSGTEAFDAGVIVGQGYVYTQVTAREVVSSGGTVYYAASSETVVGRGDRITGREVVSSGGTVYYPTTAAVKLSRYNSSSIRLYYKDAEGDYNIAGTYVWWYENSSGTQYYTRGTGVRMGGATDYYKGNGGTKTVQSSTLVRLGNAEALYRRS